MLDGKSLERLPDPLFNSWVLPASKTGVITVTYDLQKYLGIGYAISGLIVSRTSHSRHDSCDTTSRPRTAGVSRQERAGL